jgi:hypothetical protein
MEHDRTLLSYQYHIPLNQHTIERSSNDIIEFIEGSLEVKLPTIWTVEKQR